MKIDWRFFLLALATIPLAAFGCQLTDNKNLPVNEAADAITKPSVVNIRVELAGHCGNIPSIQTDHCAARPIEAQVNISQDNNPLMREVRTNKEGIAKIELTPGTYKIATKTSQFMSSAAQTIQLKPHEERTVLLSVRPMVR